MVSLYERIVALCAAKKITPTKMCSDLGITGSFAADLKSGKTKTCTLDRAKAIAAYFGVTVSELIGESPIITPEPEAEGTEQERELIAQFRGTTPAGRLRMIQAVMNIYDEEEKKKPAANKNAAG